MQKEEYEMTNLEKAELIDTVVDPIAHEAEHLKRLYGAVVSGEITNERIINELDEISRRIAELPNKFEAVVAKIKES